MAVAAGALGEALSLRELMIILGAAAVVVPLFYKLKISPILGYIFCGILLGPYALGALAKDYEFLRPFTIKDKATINTMAELGVMFLLFAIGLELSFERLKSMRKMVFVLGSLQVLISSFAIAMICWQIFGVSATASSIIGLALAMSSTAIVMQVMADNGRIIKPEGRAAFGILIFQDIAIIPIMFAVQFLAPQRLGLGIIPLVKALLVSTLAVAMVITIGRLVLRPLFRLASSIKGPEIFMAASILVLIVTGLATSAAGLSMTLGAFLAGILLAETEFRREVEATIQPFKGLLLGVFLVSVGMSLNIDNILERPFLISAAVAALIAVKALLIGGIGRFMGIKPRAALYSGILLGAGGEFAFVVIGLAKKLYVVGPRSADFALTVAALSMCLIPILAAILEKGQEAKKPIESEIEKAAQDTSGEDGHVIIAGYGRVGEVVAQMLAHHNVKYLAADSDIKRVTDGRENDARVYYGDITRPEFLRACAIRTAKAVVITMSGEAAVTAVVKAVRKERKKIPIVVRAKDGIHAKKLYELGVNEAVPETLEASLQLGEAILVEAGVPMGHIIVSVHEKRAEMREEIMDTSTFTTPSERLRAIKESTKS